VAKTRRAFTVEFKREAARQATQPGNTVATFSRDLGVHESVLRRWIQELSLDAEKPVSEAPRDDEQSRKLSHLRHQVASRRMARETIAAALGKFGTCSQADQVEETLLTPSEMFQA